MVDFPTRIVRWVDPGTGRPAGEVEARHHTLRLRADVPMQLTTGPRDDLAERRVFLFGSPVVHLVSEEPKASERLQPLQCFWFRISSNAMVVLVAWERA